mmetsp:Transcript_35378/g.46704  ORF Transcript_35378/g.46704 Transcript_35378/m.46704 type:complete len:137 (+) Transcript_35378:97-507(+)
MMSSNGNLLPIASIRRIVDQENEKTTFARVTYDALAKCCEEFISMVATDAAAQGTGLLKEEHAVFALENLGFHDYVAHFRENLDALDIKARATKRKKQQTKRGQKRKKLSPEEEAALVTEQERLFEQSRKKLQQQS